MLSEQQKKLSKFVACFFEGGGCGGNKCFPVEDKISADALRHEGAGHPGVWLNIFRDR